MAAPPAILATLSGSVARKRIEETFGWTKTIAGCTKAKLRGTRRVAFRFTFAMAAYNLIRMPRLLAQAA